MASPLPPPPPSASRPRLARPPSPASSTASAPIQPPAVQSTKEVGKFAAVVDVLFFIAAATGLVLLLLEYLAREIK